jgi:hypothetical protein
MTRLAAVAIGVAVLSLVAACGGPTSVSGAAAGSPQNGSIPTVATTTAAQKPGSAANPLPFGQTYTGESLNASISAPTPYEPTKNQFETRPARCVVVIVTITNMSKTTAVPAMMMNIQANAGGTQAEPVIDSAQNVGGATSDILPGKSLSWREAFGVSVAPVGQTEFMVQVSSMGGGVTVYFAGKV